MAKRSFSGIFADYRVFRGGMNRSGHIEIDGRKFLATS